MNHEGEEVNTEDHMDPFRVGGDLAKIPFPPIDTHDIILTKEEELSWLPGLEAAIEIAKHQINRLTGQRNGKRGIAYWESYVYEWQRLLETFSDTFGLEAVSLDLGVS